MFPVLLIFSGLLAITTKASKFRLCLNLNNQPCMRKATLIDV